jgi:hypothetical protein
VAPAYGVSHYRGMDELPDRVIAAIGGTDVVTRLASLSGSDLTSLLLAVSRRRAAQETAASLLRRYRSDRFVQPGGTSWLLLRAAEDRMAAHLPPDTELVSLPPLVPLGTHAVLGPMSQDKVVTTTRGTEVAADPTSALALEAAVRRKADLRATVRLAAFQRVARAQVPPPGYLPHFSLLGLVTAGRDTGGYRFEREAIAEHVRSLAAGLAAAGAGPAQLALTVLSQAGATIAAAVTADLADDPLAIHADPDRQAGRGYYRDLCFKLNVRAGPDWAEIGDGGFTDWTARLTASARERLLISGVGIDRVVAMTQ